jgi:HK97 family phage prohead protease
MNRISELRAAGRLVERTLPGGERTECVEKATPLRLERLNPDGTVDVVASDGTVDRYGDVIEPDGWDLTAYHRNPVILVDHDYRVSRIVGAAERAEILDGALLVRIRLDPAGSNPTAGMVRSRLEAGSLRTVSVGFVPLEWEPILHVESGRVTGFRFTEQELLEVSFVAVPANPNAGTLSD